MNRIASGFGKSPARPNGKSFIVFVTGGDPSIEATEEFIIGMISAGADLVEIGIPFSDPIAEGPVIQEANIRALSAGATVEKIFRMVESIRRRIAAENLFDAPIVFLTYLNPVFHYGYDAFFARCNETGVDGIIIPDLPFEEQGEARGAARANGIDIISLVAPTSRERIRAIAAGASGFLYIVSSMGVTGVRKSIETDIGAIMDEVRGAARGPERGSEPHLPAAVGFGISTPEQAQEMARLSDGVIVGSAIVKIAAQYGKDAAPYISSYVREMKAAVGRA